MTKAETERCWNNHNDLSQDEDVLEEQEDLIEGGEEREGDQI